MSKKKAKKRRLSIPNILPFLIVLHPAFLFLALREQFRPLEMGSSFGAFFFGILLGGLFLDLKKKLNLKINLKSVLGVSFIACPLVFYILTLIDERFNFSLYWLIFVFVYMSLGAAIYIKSNLSEQNKIEVYVSSFVVVYLILAFTANLIRLGSAYSPDSFSYYEISQTIFTNFGSVNTIRQYIYFTELGISFPYLFPAMIAVVNLLTGFSIYSGNIVNTIAALMSIYLLIKISRKLTRSSYAGLAASALLVFNPEYLDELVAARAVPLSVLFVLLILDVIVHSKALAMIPQRARKAKNQFEKFMWKKSIERDLFLMGLFGGAGMVVRFDFIVVSGLLGVFFVIYFMIKKDIFKTVPFYVFGLLVFTLPWIIFSLWNFQTLWISDNSGTMFLINPTNPQRAFLPGEEVPSLFTDSAGWIDSRLEIFRNGLLAFLVMITWPVELTVLLGVIVLSIFSLKIGKSNQRETKGLKLLVLFIAIIYFAKTIAVFLVGYRELRYHAETIIIVFFMILCKTYRKKAPSLLWPGFLATICIISMSANILASTQMSYLRQRLFFPPIDFNRVAASWSARELESLLMEHGQHENDRDVRLLNLAHSRFNAFEFGAQTSVLTFATPEWLNEYRLMYLIENFIQPNYVFADEEFDNDEFNYWIAILSRYYLFDRINNNVFALTPIETLEIAETIHASSLTDDNWEYGIHRRENVVLLENTPENLRKLEGARGLKIESLSVSIISVEELGDWIHVVCETSVRIDALAYPNQLTVLR